LSDTLTQGDVLYVNSSGDLALLPIGSDNHVLTVDGSDVNWEAAAGGGGGASELSDLSDVAASTATNRYALLADGSDFHSRAIVEADISDLGTYLTDITGQALSTLSDVTISSIASGELLKWNGSAWINNTLAEAGIQPAGSYLSNVSEDTSPQLGGSLDVNGEKIVSVSNGNIDIEPNGTGNVLIGNLTFDADQTVGAGQDNYVLTYDNTGGTIQLEAIPSVADEHVDGVSFNTSSGVLTLARNVGSDLTQDLDGRYALATHTHATSDITSGTFANARIAESNVTQHQAALTIAESQVEAALASATAFTANNYVFNVNETVGSGQDNYVLTYDHSSGEIGLEASSGGGGLSNVVEDTSPQLGGDLDGQGNNLDNIGVMFLSEQAAADADVTADGQIWVKNDTPNTLYFTDDAGSDWKIPKEQIKYKTSDAAITSDSSYNDDADLAGFVMDADTWYMVEGFLHTSTDSGVDIKFRGSFTQTPQDGAWVMTGRNSGGTNEGDFGPNIATSTVILDANNDNEHGFVVSGFIQSNASTGGTFTVEWAQNSSDGAATTVHRGSWIKLTKLS
jgi:hypothetical protein